METKYIFTDVDGTLVNYQNHLPESAVQAVRQARSSGHKVIIVTGRSKAEMYDYILDVGFDGYIGGNGSYIEYENQVLLHKTLTGDQTRSIISWLRNRDLAFYLESNSGLYASENFVERAQLPLQQYVANKNLKHLTDNKDLVNTIFPDMIYNGDMEREDVNIISFILDDYRDYLDAKEHFAGFQVNRWGGAGEQALFGDIALAGINKGTGVRDLLELLNIDVADTIAIGDAKVDIPMLDFCQIGVALASGGDEIKEMADLVTDSVDEDGFYKAFVALGLIE